jgi:hypothetical protein
MLDPGSVGYQMSKDPGGGRTNPSYSDPGGGPGV